MSEPFLRPSWLLRAVAFMGFAYLALPVLIIIPMSLSASRYLTFPPPGWSTEWYGRFFHDPVWIAAALNSLRLGLAVAAIAGTLATLAAYGLVRRPVPARRLVVAFLLSPMI